MAAKEKDSSNDWSWSSWISSAKEKSLAALSATTRDLAEFVSVVQEDTTSAVSGAASKVKQIINKEGEVEEEENVGGDEGGANQTTTTSTDGPGDDNVYDRAQTHLEMMRSDPSTYCTIPEGKKSDFLEWSTDFDLSTQQEEISRLLVASNSIRKLHSDLVPAKVSYESFWFNYFYRIHLMDKTEAHRAEIMARVHSQGQMICWDDEEDELLLNDEKPSDVVGVARQQEERAMTDSSESFVCITDEGTDITPLGTDHHTSPGPGTNQQEELVIKKEEELAINEESNREPIKMKTDNEEDDDWEKWSD